ncbi:MmcQ/YjbR family DNA-binding protein [Chitinophaga nivalis]|uniref:MmcQ/YjbR family DNA-binding protein n=1 Tax=Chitinophaga nivalis TaxID=2991709 RepID=A0ABT3ILG2_9BACT|nr:hypothetical protein [Chitinophaga nivalis]MCW3465506.1 hypothetical protein [Chitinophaga nivalis]MCW3484803.1 hypothetical protein [Chitinophaga nivalis]
MLDTLHFTDKIRAILQPLPGVREGICFGTTAFYAKKKLIARMKEDGETLAIHTDDRDTWMTKQPAVFFITEHYRNYAMMLIRLHKVRDKDLEELLIKAWRIQATKTMLKAYDEQ